MKKLVSILLAAALAISAATLLAGCGNDDFPVQIANISVKSQPQRVVVLDAAAADIIGYMGLSRKILGRSDAVDQDEFKPVAVVGNEGNPDVIDIVNQDPDLVFANDRLSSNTLDTLERKNITVIKIQDAKTLAEVKTNYETIGKLFKGKNTGQKFGEDSYNDLINKLEKQKKDVEALSGKDAPKTICYLQLDNSRLKKLSSQSFGGILMTYTNCNIISDDQAVGNDIAGAIANANPNFIFYNDEATLQAIKANKALAKISAVKENKLMQIPINQMSLPGTTAVKTLTAMNDFIYNGKVATPDQATTQPTTQAESKPQTTQPTTQADSKPQTTTQPDTKPQTQATTAPATEPANQDVSSKYKIDLKDLKLEKGDNSDDVKKMQTRLADLGYVKNDEDHVTGYYGDVTEKAVKAFQKKNGIKETGNADNATLKAMFNSGAKKA